jgi:hypothetical protein
MLGNTYNFYVRKVASFVDHANNIYVFKQAVLSPKGSTINFKNVIKPLTVHENPKNSVCGS